MIYLDDKIVENDIDVIKKMVIDSGVEVWINYKGEEYCLVDYGCGGPIIAHSSPNHSESFKSFDEFLKAPMFEGKCLPEILELVNVTY